MKSLYYLIFVCIVASGYFAYKEGFLASFHPFLDPAAKTDETLAEDTTPDDSGTEEAAPEEAPNPDLKSSSTKAKETSSAEKARAKAEKAEKDRLAKEARTAEREAADAAREAGDAARRQHNERIDAEVDQLKQQIAAMDEQIYQAKVNLGNQEVVWREEKIKTREVEREELRQASQKFRDGHEAQIEQIRADIRAKQALRQ